MRIKITFVRTFKSPNLMPLHHQMVLNRSLAPFIERGGDGKILYAYSTLKGSSNVQSGNITFLNTKVNLILSSNNEEFLKATVDKMFEKHVVKIGKMLLMPKQQQVIEMPVYTSEMKYVCLSPFVIIDSGKEPDRAETIIDPTTQEFSDMLFNITMKRMNEAGFTEEELKNFETFEAIADAEYLKKIVENNKRFSRFYRNLDGQTIIGYLLPFTLHAHPKVQEFICDTGIGLYTLEGYGMVDVVGDKPTPVAIPKSSNENENPFAGPSADEFFS